MGEGPLHCFIDKNVGNIKPEATTRQDRPTDIYLISLAKKCSNFFPFSRKKVFNKNGLSFFFKIFYFFPIYSSTFLSVAADSNAR